MTANFTRRSLLKSTASLIGAATALKPFDLFADESVRENTESDDVWAFASDMHVEVWTSKPPEQNTRFQSVVSAMLAEPVKPRRVFLLGDNVAMGTPGQYKRLLELLQPLVQSGIGIHAAMGDHDLRQHFSAIRQQLLPPAKKGESISHFVPTKPWQDGEVKHLEIIETKRANFFVLDSHDKLDQDEGTFGENQLDWLAAELDRRKDKPAILMAHHPAVDLARSGLSDSIPFWQLLGRHPQVKAYFFGHTHVWLNYRFGRVHHVNVPATSRCISLTVLGWVLMTLHDNGASLTLKTCDPNDARNGRKVELKWM